MPLNSTERLALQDACRIANAVMASDADALRVATSLVTFAQILAGTDLCARYALAVQMMDCVDELMFALRWASVPAKFREL